MNDDASTNATAEACRIGTPVRTMPTLVQRVLNNLDVPLMIVLLAASVLAFWHRRTPPSHRPSRGSRIAAAGLGAALAIWFTFLALYHNWCPVEEGRTLDTQALVLAQLAFFETTGVDYWADYGTLLSVLRKSGIMVWDPDADFSIEKPVDPRAFVGELTAYYQKYNPEVEVKFLEKRDIVQMTLRHAHTDVWFHHADTLNGKPALSSYDYTNSRPTRYMTEIFPTKEVPWLGTSVKVPAKAESVARGEYGDSYLTPR